MVTQARTVGVVLKIVHAARPGGIGSVIEEIPAPEVPTHLAKGCTTVADPQIT